MKKFTSLLCLLFLFSLTATTSVFAENAFSQEGTTSSESYEEPVNVDSNDSLSEEALSSKVNWVCTVKYNIFGCQWEDYVKSMGTHYGEDARPACQKANTRALDFIKRWKCGYIPSSYEERAWPE